MTTPKDLTKINKVLKSTHCVRLKKFEDESLTIFSRFKTLPSDVFEDASPTGIVATAPPIGPAKKKKKINKQLLSWLFIILNIVIVAAIFIKQTVEGGIKPISQLFNEAPYYRFLFLGFGFAILGLLLEGLKVYQLLWHATGDKRPLMSFKVAAIGRYWDVITPLSSGGQPFQIYYLSKYGYSADTATGIPLAKYMFWEMSFVVIGISVLCTPLQFEGVTNVVKYIAAVAIICNIMLFVFTLFLSVSRRFGKRIVMAVLKLLTKMKIVKNYRSAFIKTNSTFNKYQRCIKSFSKSPLQVITQVVYNAATTLLHASIAYCIYLAFNYAYILAGTVTPISWWQLVAMSILCDFFSGLIPVPGGSGAAELTFVGMFGALFKPDMAFWAMLFWRFFTFYIIIIVGLCITIVDSLTSNKKNKSTQPKDISVQEET